MRPPKEETYYKVAADWAEQATCPRLSVGAVLIKNGRQIAAGYNGAKAGEPHCVDVGCDMMYGHCVRSVHAEINTLNYLAEAGIDPTGAILYCTHEPCGPCMDALADAGVRQYKWVYDYPPKEIH